MVTVVKINQFFRGFAVFGIGDGACMSLPRGLSVQQSPLTVYAMLFSSAFVFQIRMIGIVLLCFLWRSGTYGKIHFVYSVYTVSGIEPLVAGRR